MRKFLQQELQELQQKLQLDPRQEKRQPPPPPPGTRPLRRLPPNPYQNKAPAAARTTPLASSPGPYTVQYHNQTQTWGTASPPQNSEPAPAPPPVLYRRTPPPVPNAATRPLKCTGLERLLSKYTQFYLLKGTEFFHVCNNCYQSRFANHPALAREFVPYHSINDDERCICAFALPSTVAILNSQCVPYSTMRPLVEVDSFRSTLAPCDGSPVSTPGPCYMARNKTIPSFCVCTTCFELFFRRTVFENRFERIPDGTQGGSAKWTCDMIMPYFRRLAITALSSAAPDFATFARLADDRLVTPPCPGAGKPITQFSPKAPEIVYSAAGGKTGRICFACYCDILANTALENEFVPTRIKPDQAGKIDCDLAAMYSKSAMTVAIQRKGIEFWRSIVRMSRAGTCRGKRGVDEEDLMKERQEKGYLADWYHVTAAPGVEVCPSCYWLRVKVVSAEHMFTPIIRPLVPGVVRMCFMTDSNVPPNISTDNCDNFADSITWRGERFSRALLCGYEGGDWNALVTVATAMESEPPPCGGNARGFKRPSGRRWIGRRSPNPADPNDCTLVFCEECYSRAVKDRPYAALFSEDITDAAYAEAGTDGFMCHTYTNRARGMLRTAAQHGDLASFARWWRHREELRKKCDAWKPVMVELLKEQALFIASGGFMQMASGLSHSCQTAQVTMQHFQQTSLQGVAQMTALNEIGSAAVVEAAMSDPGVRWGNDDVGFSHWTKASAQAQQDWQNVTCRVGFNNIPGPRSHILPIGGMGMGTGFDHVRTWRILEQARADEAAFLAVE